MPFPAFYESIDKTAFQHYLFYSPTKDPEICDPFGSEKQVNAALVKHLRATVYSRTFSLHKSMLVLYPVQGPENPSPY
jgi:hypothetical protein